MSAGADHYEVLGVPRTATAAEIKRAYFRLVRVHSPENDPGGFRRISEAYSVLSDDAARKAYDAEVPIPPAIHAALVRAESLVEKEPEKAAAEARRVAAARGAPVPARVAAVQILLRANRAGDAVEAARAIVREAPEVVEHQVLLALALYTKGDRVTALETIERASALGPTHVGACLLLIDCTKDVRGGVQALTVADRILAERRFDPLAAIPIQLRRFYALASLRRWSDMERVVADVAASIPPGDEGAARHVAWQWARLGEQARDAKSAAAAEIAFRAALAIVDHPQLRADLRGVAADAAYEREYTAAIADRALAPWVRSYVRRSVEGAPSPQAGIRAAEELTAAIAADRAAVDADWDEFAAAYPAVATRLRARWLTFRRSAVSHPRAQRRAGASAGGPIGVVVFIIVVIFLAATSREKQAPKAPAYDARSFRFLESGEASDAVYAAGMSYSRQAVIRRLVASGAATPAEAGLATLEESLLRGSTDAMIREDVTALQLSAANTEAAIARIIGLRDALRAAAAAPK